jgi:hypothetical protein
MMWTKRYLSDYLPSPYNKVVRVVWDAVNANELPMVRPRTTSVNPGMGILLVLAGVLVGKFLLGSQRQQHVS